MICDQIFDLITLGIVVLDKDLNVIKWNRWMESHSKINTDQIVGHSLFEHYPQLKANWFIRSCKSVLTFGNYTFFSQKLHKYIFPFKSEYSIYADYENMQQSATMGPLRDEDNQIQYLYIIIQDVTEITDYAQKLLEMNIRDPLTSAYNRRFMNNSLQEQVERFKRYGRPFSIIIQDIDYFKNINDQHGHLCGDFVLKNFASLNMERLRSLDSYIRYGGEEFCCILPETDVKSACIVGERLRIVIEKNVFAFAETNLNITMSQGVVEMTSEIASVDQLLYYADQMLYEAKNTGRNKIVARAKELSSTISHSDSRSGDI